MPQGAEPPPFLRPFVHPFERVDTETLDDVDYYLPASTKPAGAVVLVHGGPIPADRQVGPREWPAYVGYGSLLASAGVVAVMPEHGFRDPVSVGRALDDVRRCIDAARRHPHVDPDWIAVWAFSAGGMLLGGLLSTQPSWLRAVAATYALLDMDDEVAFPSPVGVARSRAISIPMLLVRVEHEHNWVGATQEAFLESASSDNVDVLDVPGAEHGFETIDDTDESRHAIRASVDWVVGHLRNDPT